MKPVAKEMGMREIVAVFVLAVLVRFFFAAL